MLGVRDQSLLYILKVIDMIAICVVQRTYFPVEKVMKKSVNASLIGFWTISDHVMMAKIKVQPFDVNITQAYAPTSDHSDDETEVFYEDMKQAMSYIKCGEVVIAMRDVNAKIGCGEHQDITGQFGLGSRHERGSRLLIV